MSKPPLQKRPTKSRETVTTRGARQNPAGPGGTGGIDTKSAKTTIEQVEGSALTRGGSQKKGK